MSLVTSVRDLRQDGRHVALLLLGAVFLFVLPIPGTITLRLICLFVGVVLAALVLRREGMPDVPLKSAFLAWTVVAGLSLLYAVDPAYSLSEIKSEIVYAFLAFFLFFTQTRNAQDWTIWIGTITFGVIVLSVAAVWLWATTGNAITPQFIYNGVGEYTTYLVTTLPFVVLLIFHLPLRTRWRWIVRGAPVLVLLPVYLTTNRTIWIALIVIAITLTLLLAGRSRRPARRFAGLVVLALFLVASTSMFYSTLEHRVAVSQDASEVLELTVQKDPRRLLWTFSIDEILSHPLSGAGYGKDSVAKVFSGLSQLSVNLSHAHNTFLNAGIQMGFPGIIVMAFIFASILRQYWRLYQSNHRVAQWIAACGIAMVFGVLTRNMTDDFFRRDLALLFWSLVGASLGYGRQFTAKK
ncbi:MAG TPA: O-antigen ligase family protein [Sulfuricaulis sp.]|nr:O-antigen ligase family protein [Sulfuricaulis sp.]